MLLQCQNKGCVQLNEAKLDMSTDQVICSECGKPIENISVFAKRTLKQVGQVIRTSNSPWQKQCLKCNVLRDLVVSGEEALCKVCRMPVKVHASFVQALKVAQGLKSTD